MAHSEHEKERKGNSKELQRSNNEETKRRKRTVTEKNLRKKKLTLLRSQSRKIINGVRESK